MPTWKLKVSDVNGAICVNHRVTQSWGHYSLDVWGFGSTENRLTDTNGLVEFPERTIVAPTIWRIIGPIWAEFKTIFRGSTGVSGSVWTTGMVYEWAWLSYEPGKPLPDSITVDECILGDQ